MDDIRSTLKQYNAICKRQDKLYRDADRLLGISGSRLWILYALLEHGGPLTQAEIVGMAFLPPQTINSALKKMEAEGLLTLIPSSDKRKKLLTLTPEGEALARQTAGRVLQEELSAMACLTAQQRQQLLSLLEILTDSLDARFQKLGRR